MAAPESKRTRNSIALAVLLLGLCALVGLIIVWSSHHNMPRPETAMEPEKSAAATDPAANVALRSMVHHAPPANVKSADKSAEAHARQLQQRVVLGFVDDRGIPVAYFKCRYALLSRDAIQKESREGAQTPRSPEERYPFEATSNVEGQVELLEERDFTGFKACAIRCIGLSPGWVVAERGDPSEHSLIGEHFANLSDAGGRVVVRLRKTHQIQVYIKYADGVPFEGPAGLSVYAEDDSGFLLQSRRVVVAGEYVTFEIPDRHGKVTIGAGADRLGFRTNSEWRFVGNEIEAFLTLVIDADPDQFVLIVHFENWPGAESVEVEVCGASGNAHVEASVPAGKSWKTLRAHNYGGCIVKARGKAGIWRSEYFLPKPGTTKELVAIPMKGFRVRARLVDAAGQPVYPGYINSLESAYPSWRLVSKASVTEDVCRSAEFMTRVGKTGVGELLDLYPGEVDLIFDAWNYEVMRKTVVGREGEVIDLGDVTLEPARGRIEVVLENRNPEIAYYVWLFSPVGGDTIALNRDLRVDLSVFERIARRAYVVHVAAGNGGRGVNIDVNFETGDIVTLKVDVKELKPPEVTPK